MKLRFRLVRRNIRGGKFYCVDTLTGKRTSLGTQNEDEATQLGPSSTLGPRRRRSRLCADSHQSGAPKGSFCILSEGINRWPAVHRVDVAHLFRLALEKCTARAFYHGVAFRQIAEVIGRRLKVPVISKTPEEAVQHFTWFTHFAAIDVPASSKQTQQNLGWHPTQPGLIADLDCPTYFET